MDFKLTKDADKLACAIYREYMARRKDGISKQNAKHFKPMFEKTLLPNINTDDFKESLNELSRAFPMTKRYSHHALLLGDDFIIYMERRFPDGLKQVIETLSTVFDIASGGLSILK